MTAYFRAIPRSDAARPPSAFTLAGGWCWFDQVEVLQRGAAPQIVPVSEVPEAILDALTTPRPSMFGCDLARPRLMGILNVTPDSFSDGGRFETLSDGRDQARRMLHEGAEILDVGGESTRPGAEFVAAEDETRRVTPIVAAICNDLGAPVSIDTRKADVARAALTAGAHLLNDVSAGLFDPEMLAVAAQHGAPICLMHAQGAPKTMQQAPSYDDVLLDIYDFLAERLAAAEAAGIPRDRIILDPGFGFGKTLAHNLALLRRLSLFHSLGCPLLIGVSRKSFLGTLTQIDTPAERVSGSVAAALAAVASGAQILRVHDVAATRQALSVMLPLMAEVGVSQ